MDLTKYTPVILSGGFGNRLWPLSRSTFPKQLQKLISERSMLQETVLRIIGENFEAPIVVCNQEHRFIVAEQLREIKVEPKAIVLEPVSRNTAPASAIAAILSQILSDNPLLLVLPSDHAVDNNVNFLNSISKARKAALEGKLVTLGVKVTHPETGFGYILPGEQIPNSSGCFEIRNFIEKPDKETASFFHESGDYMWNSGIFIFTSAVFLNELKSFQPMLLQQCQIALKNSSQDLDFIRLEDATFNNMSSISVDDAIMEKTSKAAVVKTDMGWSDIGSWNALWENAPKDKFGNVSKGRILSQSVKNSYIRSEKLFVAALGIQNLVIIATDDAVLVADKNQTQDVKNLVESMVGENSYFQTTHTKVYRPWGWFQSLETADDFQVKLIHLKPNAKISLQRHKFRAEHWVVLTGEAKVICGKKIETLRKNQSTFIPAGEKHRLENNSENVLEIIEIQTGEYLGEDDIERFEDQYGRT